MWTCSVRWNKCCHAMWNVDFGSLRTRINSRDPWALCQSFLSSLFRLRDLPRLPSRPSNLHEAGKCAALLMNSFRGRREVHRAPFASHPASQNVTRSQNGYGFIYKKPVGFSLGNFSTRHWKPRCICSKFWLCLTDKLMLVSFTRWCYAHKPRECKHGGAWITALPDYDSVSHRGSCNLA